MHPEMQRLVAAAGRWTNDNQGVLSVVLFGGTLLFGWVSGIFAALRRKPKLRLRLIDGPTFSCRFETGREHDGHQIHRIGIALYLRVANVGSAATSIEDVAIGYHWPLSGRTWKRVRYGLGWFWLEGPAVVAQDFHVDIGNGDIKVFPFLIQSNYLLPHKTATYLEPGQASNGVVYFEQNDSWGACRPRITNGKVRIKVRVTDTFSRSHTLKAWIPDVSIQQARRFNPSFGRTYAILRGETLPHDAQAPVPGAAPAPPAGA